MAWELSQIQANQVPRVGSSNKDPVPILKAEKRHPVQRHIPSTPKYVSYANKLYLSENDSETSAHNTKWLFSSKDSPSVTLV